MHIVAQATKSTISSEYNGWSNRETWVMNLWLTNDEYHYDALTHIMRAFETESEQAEELEHWVRSELESLEMQASVWSDLLTTSLGRVSWYEIVSSNLD
jgi:hypothetical protein